MASKRFRYSKSSLRKSVGRGVMLGCASVLVAMVTYDVGSVWLAIAFGVLGVAYFGYAGYMGYLLVQR